MSFSGIDADASPNIVELTPLGIATSSPASAQKDHTTSNANPRNETMGEDHDEDQDEDDNNEKERQNQAYNRRMGLEDPSRRITFFDAATAIVLTLLILPLMNAANEKYDDAEASEREYTIQEFFNDNSLKHASYFISYWTIVTSWGEQHRLLQHLEYFTPWIGKLNAAWLLFISCIPIVTQLFISEIEEQTDLQRALQISLYLCTCIVIKLISLIIVLIARKYRQLIYKRNRADITGNEILGLSFQLILYLVVMGLAFIPGVKSYPLFLFLLFPIKPYAVKLGKHMFPHLATRGLSEEEEYDDKTLEETERRISFVDAAVAIALTLQIVPLMDTANEYFYSEENDGDTHSVTGWFYLHKDQLITFSFSFFVIYRSWLTQAELFWNLEYFTHGISVLLWVWLLSVFFLPIASILLFATKPEPLLHVVYFSTIFIIKLLHLFMILITRSHMDRIYKKNCVDITGYEMVDTSVDLLLLIVITGISFIPGVRFFGAILLVLGPSITRILVDKYPPPLALRSTSF